MPRKSAVSARIKLEKEEMKLAEEVIAMKFSLKNIRRLERQVVANRVFKRQERMIGIMSAGEEDPILRGIREIRREVEENQRKEKIASLSKKIDGFVED